MGTRSITTVLDENRKAILTLYRQMDGYPSGMGNDLKEFVSSFRICNGIGSGQSNPEWKWANGMGCFAVQLVAHFKDGIGGFYLCAPGSTEHGEEWTYILYPDEKTGTVHVRVYAGAVTWFGMPRTKFKDMPALFAGPFDEFDADKIEKLRASISIEPTAMGGHTQS